MPFFPRRFRGQYSGRQPREERGPRRIGQTSRQTRFEQLEERTLLTGDFGYAFGFGGSGFDQAQAKEVATDSSGNVYLSGLIDGAVDFDPGPGVTTGTGDAFIAKYSPSGTLLWLKDFPGPFMDLFGPIAVDDVGNVHVTGSFDGTADFDPGPGVYELTSPNFTRDAFVLKLDSAGNFAWAGRLGGTGYNNGWGIAVDGAGNVCVAGHFEGRGDFDPGPGTAYLDSAGLRDVFVCKLNAAGKYVWAGRMGGTDNDETRGVAVDSAGNVYTTGLFLGTADFDPGPETFPLGTAGSDDVFISKLDSAGNFVWARQIGGHATDVGGAIVVDSGENVYSTGSFWGDGDYDPGPGTFMLRNGGGADVYVSKLDADGNFVWARRLGGNATENGTGVTLDSVGNVYTTGYFQDTADFDPGTGTANLSSAGGDDVFLSALDAATGNYVWAGSMGGDRTDQGSSVAADSTGNVYGTGFFGGTADFDPGPEVFNLVGAGSTDVFLVKLTENLTNRPPTDIALSGSSVVQHSPDGTTVGNLSTLDPDVGDTHTFVLLNDSAGRFQIAGNQLRVANGSLLNAGSTHDVTVRATDSGGLTRDETFTITVTGAGGQGDVLMHAFTADGYTTVSVTYQIAVATVAPFEVGFRLSSDEAFDPGDQLLGAIAIANPADRSVGLHTKTFTIGDGAGQVALPGAGAAETDGDYFLLAVADPTDAVAEADPFHEDNTATFAGIYHPVAGDVFVHGSADPESLTVSPGSLRLEVDGEVFVYPGKDVAGLRVRGHGGNDSFDVTYGAGFGTSGTFGVLVHGGAGEDSAELTGSPGNDTARVYPDSATFSGPGFEMSLNSMTEVTVHGGGGNDSASLYDSADNDVFAGSPYNGELSGPTFRSTAEGFNIIHAYGLASDTDSDVASIDDSSGNDKLKAYSTYAKLYNSQFLVRAKAFGTTHVYARNGGYDTARLFDSGGNDKVKAGPDTTKMYGPGYFVRAKFFDEMTAYASDGIDQIRFYDSAQSDKFVGTDAKTRMYRTVGTSGFSPYDNTGRKFDEVIAYSTEGGVDKARFFDTPGTDEFRGRSHKSTFQGPGVDYTVRRFEEVYAFSTGGGNDIAKLHDTIGDEHLEARYLEDSQSWAAMWTGGDKQDMLYDVTGFPRVRAYHSDGADTTNVVPGSDFLELVGDWPGGLILSASSAVPGQTLVITGDGFDPNAVTQVIFTDAAGNEIPVFATSVTAATIEVGVPPFVNTETFEIEAGTVSVSVVQETAAGPVRSAAVDGFQIGDLPQTGVAPGLVTLEFLDQTVNLLGVAMQNYQTIQDASSGTVDAQGLIDVLAQQQQHFQNLQDLVSSVIQGTSSRIELGQSQGADIFVDISSLELMDRLFVATVLQAGIAPGSGLAFASLPPAVGQAFAGSNVLDSVQNTFTQFLTAHGCGDGSANECVKDIAATTGIFLTGAGIGLGVAAVFFAAPAAAVTTAGIGVVAGAILLGSTAAVLVTGSSQFVEQNLNDPNGAAKAEQAFLQVMNIPAIEGLKFVGGQFINAIGAAMGAVPLAIDAANLANNIRGAHGALVDNEIRPNIVTILDNLNDTDPPTIGVSPAALSFAADEGGPNPSSQSLVVSNIGSGSGLSYSVSDNATWLLVSPPSPVPLQPGASESHVVSVNSSGLSADTYTATISVSDPAAANNPRTVTVTLTVNDDDGVGRFNGSYTGSYTGTANVPGYGSFPVNGGVAFAVTNGVINVTAPEAGSGTVSSSGSANFGSAGGSVGIATFSGAFVVEPSGAVSASGGWSSTLAGGGTASGSWTAARNALMAPERYVQPSPGSAVLTQEALEPIASEAIARWADEGIGSSAMDVLNQLSFQIVDLPGSHLGSAAADAIYFDRDAAGYGWFVDSTPERDQEFRLLGDAGLPAIDDGPAVGRMDLLTVVMHEMGHLLGLGDLDPLDDPDNLMNAILPPGVRRLPSPSTVDEIFADNSLPDVFDDD